MSRPDRRTPNGINIHVQGVLLQEHLANESSTGLTYNKGWQGVLPQEPVGQVGLPRGIITGLRRFLPWVDVLRVPFNKHFFDATGKMLPNMEAFLDEAALQGYRVLWSLADGWTQRGVDWTYTPTPPPSTDPQHYLDIAFPTAQASQQESWSKLLEWIAVHPDLGLEGFDAINEPASYHYANNLAGVPIETAITAYVDAVLSIWAQVNAVHPGKDFYVSLWRYSESYDELLNHPLPAYAGRTADDVFTDEIGDLLVYSYHSYFGLNAYSSKPAEKDMDRRRLPGRLKTGVRICTTEVVTRNNHTDLYPWTESDSWSEFSRARWHHSAQAMRQGSMWWPHMNWAKGFLIRHLASGGQSMFRNDHMNSYGAFVAMASFGNNPDFFTGPQNGTKNSASPDSVVCDVTESRSANYQPDYPKEIKKISHVFGGRGHCVLQADPSAKNYLYGGDGRNVIYCTDNWDHAYLGRGGGVIRCGGGQCVAVAHEGRSIIYAGSGTTYASLWTETQFPAINAMDNAGVVVAHPTGTLHVAYFYPEAGHRISFRGAFSSAMDLLLACSRVPAPDGIATDDLMVSLPSGGSIRFARMGNLFGGLHNYCIDMTDGWYSAGWVEPPDYTAANLALAAPADDQFDWRYDTQQVVTPLETGLKDAMGRAVAVRDARGRVVNFRFATRS